MIKMLSKQDIISKVAEIEGIGTKAAATKAVNAVLDAIVDGVANGDGVNIVGFGTFKPTERAARSGRNPATGEAITIPAATVPTFKAGKTFKDTVNEAKAKPAKKSKKKK